MVVMTEAKEEVMWKKRQSPQVQVGMDETQSFSHSVFTQKIRGWRNSNLKEEPICMNVSVPKPNQKYEEQRFFIININYS